MCDADLDETFSPVVVFVELVPKSIENLDDSRPSSEGCLLRHLRQSNFSKPRQVFG